MIYHLHYQASHSICSVRAVEVWSFNSRMVIPYILFIMAIITTNQIAAIKVIRQATMSSPTSSTEISIMCAQDLRDPREGRCGGAAELLHRSPGGVHHLWPDLSPVVLH